MKHLKYISFLLILILLLTTAAAGAAETEGVQTGETAVQESGKQKTAKNTETGAAQNVSDLPISGARQTSEGCSSQADAADTQGENNQSGETQHPGDDQGGETQHSGDDQGSKIQNNNETLDKGERDSSVGEVSSPGVGQETLLSEVTAPGVGQEEVSDSNGETMTAEQGDPDAEGSTGNGKNRESESESASKADLERDPVFGLKVGQSRTLQLPISDENASGGLRARAASEVKVTVKDVYYYSEVGYGDGTGQGTHVYEVKYQGQTTTAYCLQPSKDNPKNSDSFSLVKLADGKKAAKVIYYAEADAEHGGYFAVKRKGLNAKQKFIITHIAASKANGSSDWDHGVNSTCKDEAKALIEYADSMPALQDPSISVTPSEVTAAASGDVIESAPMIYQAQSDNHASISLPPGIAVRNLTDGTRSGGGTVRLAPGDQFTLYLSKPVRSSLSFDLTAVGDALLDYSAYKLKTDRDTQDLGLVFAQGVTGQNTAPFRVNFTAGVSISAVKTDCSTGNPLSGAQFGLFAGADMTEYDGTARTTGELIESAVTGTDGRAEFQHALTTDCSYYLAEIKAPYGYVRNQTDYYPFSYHLQDTVQVQTYENTFPDTPVKGEIHLYKMDRELKAAAGNSAVPEENPAFGKTQGDASLEGAIYGLYAAADISGPDQSGTILYQAGAQVLSGSTDAQGRIEWKDLWPGSYYVKEITPSAGYTLDDTVYPVVIDGSDDMTPVVKADLLAEEQVIRQPFQLIKVSENGKSDAALLEGAGFSAWLLSSLKKDGDQYDTANADPAALCPDGSSELFTDKQGYAASIPLPFGTYLVRETAVPPNHSPVKDFIVRITEHQPQKAQEWRVLLDQQFSAKLKIIKKDAATQQTILKAGAEFRIFHIDKGEYIEQVTTYPKTSIHKTFTTDETGTMTLPETLAPGRYRIEEIGAPEGYLVNAVPVEITIDDTQPVLQDPASGDLILEAIVEDKAVSGKLELVKKGPMLTGYNGTDFIYEIRGLAGAEFEVKAAENIYRSDLQKDMKGNPICLYKQGEVCAKLITDENGEARADNLPLGKYEVVETTAPYGCALIDTPFSVELKSDGKSEIVTEHLDVTDPRQKLEIGILKLSASGEKTPLKGAEFTIYAKTDIRARTAKPGEAGEILIPAGAAIGTAVSGKDGTAIFSQELPHAVYEIRETKAPKGYTCSKKAIPVNAEYTNGNEKTIRINREIRNRKEGGAKETARTGESEKKPEIKPESTQRGIISVPKTGDETPIRMILIALLVSLSLLTVFLVVLFKRMKNDIK